MFTFLTFIWQNPNEYIITLIWCSTNKLTFPFLVTLLVPLVKQLKYWSIILSTSFFIFQYEYFIPWNWPNVKEIKLFLQHLFSQTNVNTSNLLDVSLFGQDCFCVTKQTWPFCPVFTQKLNEFIFKLTHEA